MSHALSIIYPVPTWISKLCHHPLYIVFHPGVHTKCSINCTAITPGGDTYQAVPSLTLSPAHHWSPTITLYSTAITHPPCITLPDRCPHQPLQHISYQAGSYHSPSPAGSSSGTQGTPWPSAGQGGGRR